MIWLKSISLMLMKLIRHLRVRAGRVYSRGLLCFHGVSVGSNVRLGCPPVIHRHSEASIKIGNNVKLAGCHLQNPICSGAKLVLAAKEKGAEIIIGDGTGISCSVVYAARSVRIGKHVNIGANCAIYDTDFHPVDHIKRRKHDIKSIEAKPIVIHDDVWLGSRVTVLKGVIIGRGAIVAAGAVVTKDIPEFTLAGGIPARVIKNLPGKLDEVRCE